MLSQQILVVHLLVLLHVPYVLHDYEFLCQIGFLVIGCLIVGCRALHIEGLLACPAKIGRFILCNFGEMSVAYIETLVHFLSNKIITSLVRSIIILVMQRSHKEFTFKGDASSLSL
jgi:hypothetical protein